MATLAELEKQLTKLEKEMARTKEETRHLAEENQKLRLQLEIQGKIFLFSSTGNTQDIATSTVEIDGQNGNIRLGSNGTEADFFLYPQKGKFSESETATFILNSQASLKMGGNETNGNIHLFSGTGTILDNKTSTINLNGQNASLSLGSNGTDGNIFLYPKNSEDINQISTSTIQISGDNGTLQVGGNGTPGVIALYNKEGKNSYSIFGESGQIVSISGDCAEDFDMVNTDEFEPGSVTVLNQQGLLQQCREAYDKKVVGVISGAGKYKPGIILDRNNSAEKRMPISLMGKVYCKVDAKYGSIEVGDLLTTSPTLGHAMKASDPKRAFGTILGKALGSLQNGVNLIPVLVSLQ